jgi:protein-ribulosamine 3-kinase
MAENRQNENSFDAPGRASSAHGSVRLAAEPLRTAIEAAVSVHTGRPWSVARARDMSEFACHPCAVLSDGACAVFAKFSDGPNGRAQFECELAGLRHLREHAGAMIPTPIGIVPAAGGTLLIMEGLEAVRRAPQDWRAIGRALGRIHRVKSDKCGFPANGFIGPMYQDNRPADHWATFYGERRLEPRLEAAIASGNLPSSLASQVEDILRRLPELCGPEPAPSLLHGDAQQNNFISTARGAFVIDPAVYYGNPEIDLALIDCFQPAPEEVFEGYRAEMPIDPGFSGRRSLWRMSLYLAAVALEGTIHLGRLSDALREYS